MVRVDWIFSFYSSLGFYKTIKTCRTVLEFVENEALQKRTVVQWTVPQPRGGQGRHPLNNSFAFPKNAHHARIQCSL